MWKRFAIVALIAAAVALALLSLLPFVAGEAWLVELASHFRLQYLGASLAVGIALLALGHPRHAAALLPIAALNAIVAAPYVLPQARAVAGDATLKLLVVNLASRNRRFDGLLDIVEREQPDIAVLAEYTPAADGALESLAERFPYSHRVARTDPWGIALISRLPIEQARVFALGSTPAIDAELRGPRGRIRVLGIHLRPPTTAAGFAARNAQLETLAALAAGEDGPLVVAGDFNLSPYSAYFVAWLQASGLRDTLAGGLGFSWPSQFPPFGIPIDHAFVSEDFAVLSRRYLERFGSDHLPVLIELIED